MCRKETRGTAEVTTATTTVVVSCWSYKVQGHILQRWQQKVSGWGDWGSLWV